jgi:hypothetical protein
VNAIAFTVKTIGPSKSRQFHPGEPAIRGGFVFCVVRIRLRGTV